MINYWKQTIEFINNNKIDNEYNFYHYSFRPKDIKNIIDYNWSGNTINTYITILRRLGFIININHGEYVKIKDIPETLSYNKARKFLYSNDEKTLDRYLKIQMIKKKIK